MLHIANLNPALNIIAFSSLYWNLYGTDYNKYRWSTHLAIIQWSKRPHILPAKWTAKTLKWHLQRVPALSGRCLILSPGGGPTAYLGRYSQTRWTGTPKIFRWLKWCGVPVALLSTCQLLPIKTAANVFSFMFLLKKIAAKWNRRA